MMNWTWNVRSNDGAMNGLEFARCTTAGGFDRVLIHAAPGRARVEIIDNDDRVIARADLDRTGEYTPMTLVELDGSALTRSEVWPAEGASRAASAASRWRGWHLAGVAARGEPQLVAMVSRVLQPHRPPGRLGTTRPAPSLATLS
jgi:hypothetical protein